MHPPTKLHPEYQDAMLSQQSMQTADGFRGIEGRMAQAKTSTQEKACPAQHRHQSVCCDVRSGLTRDRNCVPLFLAEFLDRGCTQCSAWYRGQYVAWEATTYLCPDYACQYDVPRPSPQHTSSRPSGGVPSSRASALLVHGKSAVRGVTHCNRALPGT